MSPHTAVKPHLFWSSLSVYVANVWAMTSSSASFQHRTLPPFPKGSSISSAGGSPILHALPRCFSQRVRVLQWGKGLNQQTHPFGSLLCHSRGWLWSVPEDRGRMSAALSAAYWLIVELCCSRGLSLGSRVCCKGGPCPRATPAAFQIPFLWR